MGGWVELTDPGSMMIRIEHADEIDYQLASSVQRIGTFQSIEHTNLEHDCRGWGTTCVKRIPRRDVKGRQHPQDCPSIQWTKTTIYYRNLAGEETSMNPESYLWVQGEEGAGLYYVDGDIVAGRISFRDGTEWVAI